MCMKKKRIAELWPGHVMSFFPNMVAVHTLFYKLIRWTGGAPESDLISNQSYCSWLIAMLAVATVRRAMLAR